VKNFKIYLYWYDYKTLRINNKQNCSAISYKSLIFS
jgi:hypothetical protein